MSKRCLCVLGGHLLARRRKTHKQNYQKKHKTILGTICPCALLFTVFCFPFTSMHKARARLEHQGSTPPQHISFDHSHFPKKIPKKNTKMGLPSRNFPDQRFLWKFCRNPECLAFPVCQTILSWLTKIHCFHFLFSGQICI